MHFQYPELAIKLNYMNYKNKNEITVDLTPLPILQEDSVPVLAGCAAFAGLPSPSPSLSALSRPG